METTIEKSEYLAFIINMMKPFLHMIDLDYAKHAAAELRKQACFQDSASILNPHYNPEKTNLIALQGKALEQLVSFIESLKKCDELKQAVAVYEQHQGEISKLFI